MRSLRARVEALEKRQPAREVVFVNITDDDDTWRDKPAWAGGKPVDRAALEAADDVEVYVIHWTRKWREFAPLDAGTAELDRILAGLPPGPGVRMVTFELTDEQPGAAGG